MTFNGERNIGFRSFLDKFTILDNLKWDKQAIGLAVKQVCEDIKAENVHYSEISLSINKYVRTMQYGPADIIRIIYDMFNQYSAESAISVGLLLSLRYDSPRDTQREYADLIDTPNVRHMLRGVDLVGDENYFDPDFYKPIFDKWRAYGKVLRAHVGEMPGKGSNVREAIRKLAVTRIAHGTHADDDTLRLAIDQRVCFDVALHSNLITGACTDLPNHPLKRMLELGCTVTLNTDDPIQCGCCINDEFELAIKSGLIDASQAETIMENACSAAGFIQNPRKSTIGKEQPYGRQRPTGPAKP